MKMRAFEATNVMWVAPSLTTFSNLLPAYRIYTIDGARPNSTWVIKPRDILPSPGNCEWGYLDCAGPRNVGAQPGGDGEDRSPRLGAVLPNEGPFALVCDEGIGMVKAAGGLQPELPVPARPGRPIQGLHRGLPCLRRLQSVPPPNRVVGGKETDGFRPGAIPEWGALAMPPAAGRDCARCARP